MKNCLFLIGENVMVRHYASARVGQVSKMYGDLLAATRTCGTNQNSESNLLQETLFGEKT